MSLFLADSTGPLEEFASIGGYANFREWALSLEKPAVKSFVQRGWSEDLQELVVQLGESDAPGEIEEQRYLLLEAAKVAKDIIIVSDGMADEDDELRAASQQDLREKYGIEEFEYPHETSSIKHIGYAPKSEKWYGWSHRAIAGFGIGSTVEEGDIIAEGGEFHDPRAKEFPVGYKAETLNDAKEMAKSFALAVAEEARTLGGKGSGNFNHGGRPGERGGSADTFSEDEQYDAISDYLTGRFQPINKELRSEKIKKYADTVAKMDSAFENDSIAEKTGNEAYYRGMNGKAAYDAFSKMKAGDIIGEKAYLSTTSDPEIAELFSKHTGVSTGGEHGKTGAPGVLITIKAPKGTRFLHGNDEESERIFQRGTRMKIVSVQRSGKLVKVKAEILK